VQHVDADNLGKFSLSFEAEDDSQYDLQATAPTFFDTPNGEYTGLVKGEKNKKNVTVRPEAWLRIRFLSTALSHYITLSTPTVLGLNDISSPSDSLVTIRCTGNQHIRVIAGIRASGTSIGTLDTTVYCPAHDTTDFTIRF
jgi:hypothetical protein